MFVTSDIFKLNQVRDSTDLDRREDLLCGVALHGTRWPGYQSAARFLIEAGKHCGLLDGLQYPSYNRVGAWFTRPISLESFEQMARGQFSEAPDVTDVMLKGLSPAQDAKGGDIMFGGEVGGAVRTTLIMTEAHGISDDQSKTLSASFIFPLNKHPIETAVRLFELSVDMLGAEFGSYFLRDASYFPFGYSTGRAPPLDRSMLANEDAEEIERWAGFARNGELWSGKWPILRDLYEVNLLSERHTSTPIGGLGYLTEWISVQPGRGRLEDIGQGRLLWVLTDAEIFNVRPLLNRAGMLLSCRDRVYRDLAY
jgi:hypothetical protein